ncbi:MAG: hypothetical protein LBH59_05330 [Planctomycetaceae bacterium]|jgi:predicted outer membrane protein|nr:hypothetical protein [Planctomycetaceae bacterium]
MFKTFVLTTSFVCAFVLSGVIFVNAQETQSPTTTNAVDVEPIANRLEVETADLAQPAAKGITQKKEYKGTVPRGAGKLSKEQKETIRNLDKTYAKLIDILQVRIDLLKKERKQKISELISTMSKEQTNTDGK